DLIVTGVQTCALPIYGLPVELEIERELGLETKADIERYGVAKFNEKCRDSVFKYIDEWNRLTERIGFWIDMDDAYVTLSNDYIEIGRASCREREENTG